MLVALAICLAVLVGLTVYDSQRGQYERCYRRRKRALRKALARMEGRNR